MHDVRVRGRPDDAGRDDTGPLPRRRIDALCLDLCRLACQTDSSERLMTFAVEQIARTLNAVAVGIWTLEHGEGSWRLAATAGAVSERAVRAVLMSLPATLTRGEVPCPTAAAAEATRRWCCTAGLPGSADSLAIAPALLPDAGGIAGVLVVWSLDVNPGELCAAADAVARDLAAGLASVRRTASHLEQARFGSTVFDFAPLAIIGIDARRCCTRWSPAAEELFGWPESEVLDRPVLFVPSRGSHDFWAAVERSLCHGGPQQECFIGQRWDGSELHLRARFVPITRTAHSAPEVMLMISDETGYDSVRRYLQIEREVSSLLSQATSAVMAGTCVVRTVCAALRWEAGEFWQATSDGRHWRRTALWERSRTGLETGVDQQETEIRIDSGLPGRVRAERQVVRSRSREHAAADRRSQFQTRARAESGIAVPVVVRSEIPAVLVFYGNVSESEELPLNRLLTSVADKLAHLVGRDTMTAALARAEESLRQTQKMEAIGLLAGGIAHDFNNLLTLILGNAELLLTGLVAGDAGREALHEIQAAGEQGASLTRQLLTFSRKRPRELQVLYLSEVLGEMQRMLQRVAGASVVMQTAFAPDTHPVRMDRVEFEQVMLNLTANARDAMPSGGTLSIELSNAFLGLKEVAAYPDLRPGDFAVLTVADSGCGMDSDTQARAFEPFFTTKNVDRGTGLGLATVYGIVRGCGGIVEFESNPGAGTRFRICLPRAAVGIEPRRSDERVTPVPRGSETVVVVEDEDVLRNLVQRILEVHGYRVHACASAFEALRLLQRPDNSCDLLLTDVVMPHMSGPELVRESLRIRPMLPTLLMSGYPSLVEGFETEGDRASALLPKPFTSEGLVRAVRRQLDAAGTSPR